MICKMEIRQPARPRLRGSAITVIPRHVGVEWHNCVTTSCSGVRRLVVPRRRCFIFVVVAHAFPTRKRQWPARPLAVSDLEHSLLNFLHFFILRIRRQLDSGFYIVLDGLSFLGREL